MAGNGQVNATLAAVYGFSNALEVLAWSEPLRIKTAVFLAAAVVAHV
jgi:hypothetical protein